ncbi:MAG TPA: sensor histidine kinase, partial [Actinomycetes bacterium]|nr:sensor histidine kinase [Actinomycetes bacterium]
MADVGANPARIIPAWRDFVDEHVGTGVPFRGVGEPIWAERSPAELVECQLHESLLNIAFAKADSFWLVCPYDTAALAEEVLDEARRSHPYVSVARDAAPSPVFSGLEEFSKPFAVPLPPPPVDAETLMIAFETLPEIRRMVGRRAKAAGFDKTRQSDFVFVANEIATNSLRHGGGRGVFRIWRDGRALVAETNDTG